MRQIVFDHDQSAGFRDIHGCKMWTDGVLNELACIASTKFEPVHEFSNNVAF